MPLQSSNQSVLPAAQYEDGHVRQRHPNNSMLVESYCTHCGMLIAASPLPAVLTVIEAVHECPVHGRYPIVRRGLNTAHVP